MKRVPIAVMRHEALRMHKDLEVVVEHFERQTGMNLLAVSIHRDTDGEWELQFSEAFNTNEGDIHEDC
jgi:hypothetical protein